MIGCRKKSGVLEYIRLKEKVGPQKNGTGTAELENTVRQLRKQ